MSLERAKRDGRKFLNPVPTEIGGFRLMLKVLPRFLLEKRQGEPETPLGPFMTDPAAFSVAPASGLRVTWFGHSGSLIEIDGMRVLVDPVWDERASPVSFAGPKRFFPPTLALDELPELDIVLVTHDHYDHLGERTIRALAALPCAAGARWVTSLGVGTWLRRFGVEAERITEMDWTESVAVGGLRVDAWPTRHFSGRGVRDRFTTLWSSFVLEGPRHRVYVGADSGPWPGFAEIGQRYDGFDLTMLEIGAYDPLWWQIHLGPDEAVKAFQAMGGRGLFMPVHWGLFNLALHAWRQPVERVMEVADDVQLFLPRPGVPTEVTGEAVVTEWWRAAGRRK